jgi:hypothetical protein
MVAKRGYGAVKRMNLGGRTGDMMYSRGYGVDERSRRMPTELLDRGPTALKKGGKVKGYKQGGVIKRQRGGPGRRNLLEEMGRLDAERRNPNRRAERSRVIRELNRGFKKGGAARMHAGGPMSKADIAKANREKNLKNLEKDIKVSQPKHPAHVKPKPKVKAKSIIPKGRHPEKTKTKAKSIIHKGRHPDKISGGISRSSKDAAIMKAEKARRAKVKKDMPTGRSAAAKARDIAMQRKKHVLGTLKTGPSGKR